jgi:hypothetical protein
MTVPTPAVPRFGLKHRLEHPDRPPGSRPLPKFEIQYHAALTEQACPDDPTIRDNLSVIVAANVATDLDQFDSALHFDNCAFAPGAQRIDALRQLIASGTLEENPYLLFGTMIHTVQDFYAHSNWVELHEGERPVPVWDLVVGSLPAQIVSGTFFLDTPKLCGPGAPTHAELNKDSPDSPEGAKVVESGPNAGQTLFALAFAAALRATELQFEWLRRVVR